MTVAQRLIRWYEKNGRRLPWRETRDPYRILVSEIMLQQTQVPRGLLFYGKWLKRFPSFDALATATNEDVIRAWAGLGYNRRALMLRDLARAVVSDGVPNNEMDWRALKGIGPYTAAALACFSLHQPALPIDTNIRRVLARVFLGLPYPQIKSDDRIRRASVILLDHPRFYDVPQALFDLATAICTKTPSCAHCPLHDVCQAAPKFLSGRVRVPKAMIKKPSESRHADKPHPDRIYRGRILQIVREHPGVLLRTLGPLVDPDFDPKRDQTWLQNMTARMTKDGLLQQKNGRLHIG